MSIMPAPDRPSRRFFLKSAGISLALPLLESLSPRRLSAAGALGSQAGDTLA